MRPSPKALAVARSRSVSRGTVRAVVLAMALVACRADPAGQTSDASAPCTAMFGRPGPQTGLSEAECAPRCTCAATPFEQPDYTEADLAALESLTLLDAPGELKADPYASPPAATGSADAVCAVLREPAPAKSYRLRTYDSPAAAKAAGAQITHVGACGLCSPLRDLAVYIRRPDLTAPVRDCGVKHGNDKAAQLACLEALGFDRPCAQVWSYNTDHTRARCLGPCVAALTKPYNEPDGAINACLQCDEEVSGPVFKAVAGRSRRNTGVASTMCRPCSEVTPLVHRY